MNESYRLFCRKFPTAHYLAQVIAEACCFMINQVSIIINTLLICGGSLLALVLFLPIMESSGATVQQN